jgi:probable HAF family extracellular repeat protein
MVAGNDYAGEAAALRSGSQSPRCKAGLSGAGFCFREIFMAARTFGIRKKRNEGRWLLAAVLMATTALVMTPKAEAQQASFEDLFEQTFRATEVIGISSDGTRSVLNGTSGHRSIAVVRDGTGMRNIGGLDPVSSVAIAKGMSADGSTIVGYSLNTDLRTRAFRWNANGMDDLGTLNPNGVGTSYALGASHDGRMVVGQSSLDGHNMVGFVWIEGASGGEGGGPMYALLGTADTEGNVAANGISSNGRIAVGDTDTYMGRRAIYWHLPNVSSGQRTEAIALAGLGGNPSSAIAATTNATSHGIIVGYAVDDNWNERAVRWVQTDNVGYVIEDLGVLAGHIESKSLAISNDGTVIGGNSTDVDGRYFAFRWEDGEMLYLGDFLLEHGVDIGTLRLTDLKALSGNGSVMGGTMVDENGDERAYLARVGDQPGPGPGPGPGGGLMDVEEYHQTLYSAAGIANTGEYLTWLPMNGAHHRPLMLTPNLSGDMCAWATGDFAQHGPSSTGMALAEIGACTDLAGGNVRIGGAVGTTASWQDLALGGSARMQGQYVLSEIDWQPDGTPLLLSLTGMLGSYKANIDRAYSNGAATAISNGETNAFGGVVRVRADWLEAAVIGNTSINPYASLGFGRLHVDGYTESGGPFPAVFDAQSLGHVDIRLGVTAVTEFSTTTKLSTTLEVAHRAGDAAGATGNVPGLFNFSLGGGTYAQTWARVGAELDHKINENLSLSASTHLATNGRDPSLAFSAGIKGAF